MRIVPKSETDSQQPIRPPRRSSPFDGCRQIVVGYRIVDDHVDGVGLVVGFNTTHTVEALQRVFDVLFAPLHDIPITEIVFRSISDDSHSRGLTVTVVIVSV